MLKKIALYGGSFDPPHVSHVMVAAYALSVLAPDVLMVVPCWAHGHGKRLTPYADRLEMVRRAMAPLGDRVVACDVEASIQSRYTADMLARVAELNPGAELTLIIGADVAWQIKDWHRGSEVRSMAKIAVIGREGVLPAGDGLDWYPVKPPGVSSSQIRLAFGHGEPETVRRLMPARVYEYAVARGLYATPPCMGETHDVIPTTGFTND